MPHFPVIRVLADFNFQGTRFSAGVTLPVTAEFVELASLYPEHLKLSV